MLDRSLMQWVKLPFLGTIHQQSNKFVMGVKIRASCTGDSKLNDSPAYLSKNQSC